jgi:hypothetical protein
VSVYRVIDVVSRSATFGSRRSIRQDVHIGDGGELVYRTKLQLSFKYEEQA